MLLYTAISSPINLRQPHYTSTSSAYLLGIATLLSAQSLLTLPGPQLFTTNPPNSAYKAKALVKPSISGNTDIRTAAEDLGTTLVSVETDAEATEIAQAEVTIPIEAVSIEAVPTEEIVFYDGENNSNATFDDSSNVAYMTLTDSATVSLAGGSVSHATLSAASTVAMTSSSHISHIDLMGNSALKISDEAEVARVTLHNFSTVEVAEDSQISHLNLTDRTEGKISGGTFGFITLEDESEAHLWDVDINGGSFVTPGVFISGGAVTIEAGTALHVYGRSLNFSDGKVSGTWTDETPFEFALVMVNEAEDGFAKIPRSLPNEVTFHEVEATEENATEENVTEEIGADIDVI